MFSSATLKCFSSQKTRLCITKTVKIEFWAHCVIEKVKDVSNFLHFSIFQFTEYDLLLWNLGDKALSKWTPRLAWTIALTTTHEHLVHAYKTDSENAFNHHAIQCLKEQFIHAWVIIKVAHICTVLLSKDLILGKFIFSVKWKNV